MAHDDGTFFDPHDHAHCAATALSEADARAMSEGLRLTPVRRRTLEILLEEHRALGAYDVLERLAQDGYGTQPPVAYRALDFLVENGFAHRIQRLNAFAACMHSAKDHQPVFFICETCKIVDEAPQETVKASLDAAAKAIGFQPERAHIEVVGVCAACAA